MFLPETRRSSIFCVSSSAWTIFIVLNIILSSLLLPESNAHHIPLRYRRKIKYGVKLAAAVGIAATKKVWLPLPIPFPIPIPIFKTYQPVLIKKKAWLFGGFGHGLGFGGLHGGLGMGGYGYG